MGAVGCVGTVKEFRCCLLFYAFVLMAVFLLETCVGVLAYMYESAIHEELSRNLNKTMNERYSHFENDVTKAVDFMQSTVRLFFFPPACVIFFLHFEVI
uniref:Uncharacterized protein n=1 Tax=Biomphalaria glabrata TaxID=6526 RepID=A0A2C9KMJ8_BIOGL